MNVEEEKKITRIIESIQTIRPDRAYWSFFAYARLRTFIRLLRERARANGFDANLIDFKSYIDTRGNWSENLATFLDHYPVSKPIPRDENLEAWKEYAEITRRQQEHSRLKPRSRETFLTRDQAVIITKGKAGIRVKVVPHFFSWVYRNA